MLHVVPVLQLRHKIWDDGFLDASPSPRCRRRSMSAGKAGHRVSNTWHRPYVREPPRLVAGNPQYCKVGMKETGKAPSRSCTDAQAFGSLKLGRLQDTGFLLYASNEVKFCRCAKAWTDYP
jgi:hypothetical protein